MKNKIITLIQIILIILIILSSIEIVKWVIYNNRSKKLLNDISSTVTVVDESQNISSISEDITVEKYDIDFKTLKESNPDTVAWIKVNGTAIEYPIVQTTNNDYYLSHSFDKTYNSAGWVFADYRNKLDGSDKNIIIYGHNRRDGSMFGSQQKTKQPEWYNNPENLQINFVTENEKYLYEVFSVYEIEAEDYYIQTNFPNGSFHEFVTTLKNRSIKDFGVELTEEDQILTLSTCGNSNKYRVVLHAKKIQ